MYSCGFTFLVQEWKNDTLVFQYLSTKVDIAVRCRCDSAVAASIALENHVNAQNKEALLSFVQMIRNLFGENKVISKATLLFLGLASDAHDLENIWHGFHILTGFPNHKWLHGGICGARIRQASGQNKQYDLVALTRILVV